LAGAGHSRAIVLLDSRGECFELCFELCLRGFLRCNRVLLDGGSYFCFDCLVCVRGNMGEDSCAVGRAKLLINQGNAFNQVPYTLLTEATYTVCTLDCISFMRERSADKESDPRSWGTVVHTAHSKAYRHK
jgi:hypothetical protein